jgi:hypothetical protein
MAVSSVDAKGTPEAQLRSLIEKFDPKDQKLIRSVRSAVRKRLPTPTSYCTTTRASSSSGILRRIDPRMRR